MKKILLMVVSMMIIIPTTVKADYLVSYHNYGVTSAEEALIEEEEAEERNVFEELYYRVVMKDTRDAVDYVILGTIIFLMLVTIVVSNKKSYVIPGNTGVFLEDTSDNVDVRNITPEPVPEESKEEAPTDNSNPSEDTEKDK